MAMENQLGEAHALNGDYPTCDKCFTNYDVYCMDCQTHSVDCTCLTLDFYCSACDNDFTWNIENDASTTVYYNGLEDLEKIRDAFSGVGNADIARYSTNLETKVPFSHNLNDLIEDMDEILDIEVINDSSEAITTARAKNAEAGVMHPRHSCPNCYRSEDHACETPEGMIIDWSGHDGFETLKEIKCYCEPSRMYICTVCECEREEIDMPWIHRSTSEFGENANLITEAVKNSMGMFGSKANEEGNPTCSCSPEPAYFCGRCRVTRTIPTAEWTAIDGYKEALASRRKETGLPPKPTLASSTKSTPVPYSNPSKYGTNGGYADDWDDDYKWLGMSKCRHYGEAVALPDGTKIHCSSLWDQRKDTKDYPDRGLYFDWSWKPDWRSELSLWPDFGIPTNMKATADAIKEYYTFAKKGEHIEIGCIGGHGRTGTALACMAVLAGLPVDQAGTWVKKNYCKEAIESQSQFWWIKWFAAYTAGTPLPEKPVYKPMVAAQICTVSQHYVQYVANPKSTKCTIRKDECKMFDSDFKKFVEGKVESHVLKAALELKSLSDYNNIDGYAVPKGKAGDKSHNRNDARCQCDYCRYRGRGMLAFLDEIIIKEVYIKTPSGIIRTDVTPEFTPKPPMQPGTSLGHRIGEYVWNTWDGADRWVWDVEKRAKSRYIRENAARNKIKNEEAGKGNPAGTRIEGVGSGTIKVKDLQKANIDEDAEVVYPDKPNHRNKKNSNRNSGRRRSGKRRR